MNLILAIICYAALIGTILPSILYMAGSISLDQVKQYMLYATILWFVVSPIWMRPQKQDTTKNAATG